MAQLPELPDRFPSSSLDRGAYARYIAEQHLRLSCAGRAVCMERIEQENKILAGLIRKEMPRLLKGKTKCDPET